MMETRLQIDILRQPDDTTCGPTCLHSIYRYFGDQITLTEVIQEAHALEDGGTLAVFLGCHALRRGYQATLYTYNLAVFDPTWFANSSISIDLGDKLRLQEEAKTSGQLRAATRGYLTFLEAGGHIRFEDLTRGLIRKYLLKNVPILTGLSSTFLYRSAREISSLNRDDDIRGEPSGHFVVLCGYHAEQREVLVADPYGGNPLSPGRFYTVSIDRVVCAILLGVLTHDANLLIIEPPKKSRRGPKT